jgi:hypothetical protein
MASLLYSLIYKPASIDRARSLATPTELQQQDSAQTGR